VSAQVIVRSRSGKRIRGDVPITAANVHEYAPSPEDVAVVRPAFEGFGFETGPLVGISFSITAPASVFERSFRTTLRVGTDGSVEAVQGQRSLGPELPLASLPRSLSERLVAVTFSPPAELHAGAATMV
jgi:hypothetical protein